MFKSAKTEEIASGGGGRAVGAEGGDQIFFFLEHVKSESPVIHPSRDAAIS